MKIASSEREVRVREGSSYRKSTVLTFVMKTLNHVINHVHMYFASSVFLTPWAFDALFVEEWRSSEWKPS